MKKKLLIGGVVASTVVLGACSQKEIEPLRDAPTAQRNTDAADVISMPDGFSNVATKCDHGNRVYVVFKGTNTYGAISVVPHDPTCGG